MLAQVATYFRHAMHQAFVQDWWLHDSECAVSSFHVQGLTRGSSTKPSETKKNFLRVDQISPKNDTTTSSKASNTSEMSTGSGMSNRGWRTLDVKRVQYHTLLLLPNIRSA